MYCLCPKKRPVNASKPPLLLIPVTGPWDVTATDCVGPLPISLTGNKYIIVISDLYTNFTEAFVVPTVQTSIAAQGFTDNIYFFFMVHLRNFNKLRVKFYSKLDEGSMRNAKYQQSLHLFLSSTIGWIYRKS